MPLWSREPYLGCLKTISYNMDSDYVCALALLSDTIPSFDFSDFTNKETSPPPKKNIICELFKFSILNKKT